MNNNNIKKTKKQVSGLKEKRIDLTNKKKGNEIYLKMAEKHKTKSGLSRIKDCGHFFHAITDKDFDKTKIILTNRCKDRFCPYCSYFKAREEAIKILILMSYIKEIEDKEFIFISLTSPNVTADELSDEITDYNESFRRLIQRKKVDFINQGYVRKLEITYNSELVITEELYFKQKDYWDRRGLKVGDTNPNYDTYHPHFHIIMAVNKSYFTDSKYYINQKEWLDLWRDCKRDETITQVNVKKVRKDSDKSHLELAKYTAKDSDYLINQSVFDVFYEALYRRRVMVYNKLFNKAHNLYKEYQALEDDEKHTHILHQFFEEENVEYIYWLLYKWGYGKYIEEEKRLLTGQEREKYNN